MQYVKQGKTLSDRIQVSKKWKVTVRQIKVLTAMANSYLQPISNVAMKHDNESGVHMPIDVSQIGMGIPLSLSLVNISS